MSNISFLYRLAWVEQIMALPPLSRRKLHDAIARFVLYGEEPVFTYKTDRDWRRIKAVWENIRNDEQWKGGADE